MKKPVQLPWSVPVSVHDIPEAGRRFELAADQRVREAIVKIAGLQSLPRFEASFDVTRRGREGLRVAGSVSATVGQICVATLEPIDNSVEEEVDLVFVPEASPPQSPRAEGDVATVAAVPEQDAPEPMVGGSVDLGAIAIEFLLLGIDPYPRKEGAVFESPATDDTAAHPFAALAELKKRPSGQNH
jgi:uncharacterized metal-binding protein YceD (DUF177 family)